MLPDRTSATFLNQVHYRSDGVLITKDGKPVAALVDIELSERIRRMREDFLDLTDRIGQAYAGVDPGLAECEIGEAIACARKARVTAHRSPSPAHSTLSSASGTHGGRRRWNLPMSPTVLRIGPFRSHFFTREGPRNAKGHIEAHADEFPTAWKKHFGG